MMICLREMILLNGGKNTRNGCQLVLELKTEDNNNEDNDVYNQTKELRPTKFAAKAETYSTDSR